MRNNNVVLNTHIEKYFKVFTGSKWLDFKVTGNKTYHKDSSLDFWLVADREKGKEHKLLAVKAQELYDKKLLIYV